MAKLVSALAFVQFLIERWKAGDGYIMGAKGQNPRSWSPSSWWFTQYIGKNRTKALSWRAHAQRVWDCNGLAEGYYEDQTKVNINTRARNNYSSWCNPKGTGMIPAARRVPGAAVFHHNGLYIHHVGYLVAPVTPGNPAGDWYVIEAKGVQYGVVRTRLSDRKWNRWGWMTKYFDYAQPAAPVVPAAPKMGTVLGTGVNIRSGPGVGYKVLGVVNKGDMLELSGAVSGGWTGVIYKGTKAWIYGRYIKAVVKS
jgi:hypothetical protein